MQAGHHSWWKLWGNRSPLSLDFDWRRIWLRPVFVRWTKWHQTISGHLWLPGWWLSTWRIRWRARLLRCVFCRLEHFHLLFLRWQFGKRRWLDFWLELHRRVSNNDYNNYYCGPDHDNYDDYYNVSRNHYYPWTMSLINALVKSRLLMTICAAAITLVRMESLL